MASVTGTLGFLGAFICLALLIINKIKKRQNKQVLLALGISVVLFIGGMSLAPDQVGAPSHSPSPEEKAAGVTAPMSAQPAKNYQSLAEAAEKYGAIYNENKSFAAFTEQTVASQTPLCNILFMIKETSSGMVPGIVMHNPRNDTALLLGDFLIYTRPKKSEQEQKWYQATVKNKTEKGEDGMYWLSSPAYSSLLIGYELYEQGYEVSVRFMTPNGAAAWVQDENIEDFMDVLGIIQDIVPFDKDAENPAMDSLNKNWEVDISGI